MFTAAVHRPLHVSGTDVWTPLHCSARQRRLWQARVCSCFRTCATDCVAALPAGVPLQLASNREEFRALAPLVVATLRALNTFSDDAFRIHLAVRVHHRGSSDHCASAIVTNYTALHFPQALRRLKWLACCCRSSSRC